MSLDIWLSRGKKVTIGGRDFLLMPLPLSRLYALGSWLEENCNDVVQGVLADLKDTAQPPNPFTMVAKVLLRVNTLDLIYDLLTWPKNPITKEPVNKDVTKEFLADYLDIPTAHMFFNTFVEVNEIQDLLKNLYRLPVVQKVWGILQNTFGLPFLNSLPLSMGSAPQESEGSPSPKSTSTSAGATTEEQEAGSSGTSPRVTTEPRAKELIQ